MNKEKSIKKRLVLGDVHGHIDSIKQAYLIEQPDDVIILGDYFDSFHGTDNDIISCFNEIIEMKKAHSNGEFILLIGNHDFHYIVESERYSGKRYSYADYVKILLNDSINDGNLQYFYADKKNRILFSHAGLTNSWIKHNKIKFKDIDELNNVKNEFFKFTWESDKKHPEYGYGNGIYASPIWIRPMSLLDDMYKDKDGYMWTQCVGHTTGRFAQSWIIDNNGDFVKYYGPMEYGPESVVKLFVIDSLPNNYLLQTLDKDGNIISQNIKQL